MRPQMFCPHLTSRASSATSLCTCSVDYSLAREPRSLAAWGHWPTPEPCLPGIYQANSLTSSHSLLTSHPHSEACYPRTLFSSVRWTPHPTLMIPIPSPQLFFFSYHGTCSFPTSYTTNWLIFLIVSLSYIVIPFLRWNFHLLYWLMYPQNIELCLAQRRHSWTICWINE